MTALVNQVVSAGFARYCKPKWPASCCWQTGWYRGDNSSSLLWAKGFLFFRIRHQSSKIWQEARMKKFVVTLKSMVRQAGFILAGLPGLHT
jgi:hypothetical protein